MSRTNSSEATIITPQSVIIFLLSFLLSNQLIQHSPSTPAQNKEKPVNVTISHPTYAIYDNCKTEEHLVHVKNVLQRLGYQRVPVKDNNWNLLWAHDYPFVEKLNLRNIKKNQLVNHWPGCGFLTNKVDLSTSQLPYMPKSFRLPSQKALFLKHVEEYPATLYVVKHNEHRHINIRAPSEIDLESNMSFIQEFIQKPFLVDGHKFDIGIYVVITSINPLRVYMYGEDILFRYCMTKYHPFNGSDVSKYVVGDDYLPTWEVPSLRKYYNTFGGSMRSAFDAYVREKNLEPQKIWTQVEDIVRRTILAKEFDINRIAMKYKTKNFFDLIRFDMILDENLKVYLLEANMSPNLSSSHFKQNSLLYEQVLYGTLNLVGIGSPLLAGSEDQLQMITSERNLAVDLHSCAKNGCDSSCQKEECDLCISCMNGSQYEMLENAHREHLHSTNMKRIFPKPIANFEKYSIQSEVRGMTKWNSWMTRWFYHKCRSDESWCH